MVDSAIAFFIASGFYLFCFRPLQIYKKKQRKKKMQLEREHLSPEGRNGRRLRDIGVYYQNQPEYIPFPADRISEQE